MAAGLAAAVSPAGYHRAGRSNSTVGFEKSDGDRRAFAAFQYFSSISKPMLLRCVSIAASAVEADPRNGSRTMSST